MGKILRKWEISEKVLAVVTDNAVNVVNAVRDMTEIQEQDGLTCAAHTMQLVVNEALACHQDIQEICQKAGKLVGHFRHSNVTTTDWQSKQAQLNIKSSKLIQSVKTRWNSTLEMLERLIANRLPISNVLTDRNVTTSIVARKLEITEVQWVQMEELVNLLRPLQMATTVFCGDNYSPASIVRPLIWKIVRHHMQPIPEDSDSATTFKIFVSTELGNHFKLTEWENFSNVSARLTASFLDPRSKNLEDELTETIQKVQEHVRTLLDAEPVNTTSNAEDDPRKAVHKTALEFLFYQPVRCLNDIESQLQAYLTEPQLRFDLDHLEWWKTRADKFPALAILAKKYLCIPATSASAERTFSTAGNIVTSKRNCLSPENVNMLVFLLQNKSVYA
ncbi:hypothetical protein DMN91_002148 [Ooceraea biroi]|uniref:HAT C-terminal dimerisation domain-containing protein n=3 Tax=Ooceraea biroi TaxID=2015173 RepID=A0A3L8E0S8_OOCBI|nr:zinc finger BED domain-containing protein 1 [Ooceraea biroi]RLU25470.1 hypothetical protein DMN91_001626 [Ooceraea biroi]RLU25985.1 hypothetical protein DMN91_002148 [Ooceraea biroi]